MKNKLILALILGLVTLYLPAQLTLYPGIDYLHETNDFSLGNEWVYFFDTGNQCLEYQTHIFDFNTINVPDRMTIYDENGDTLIANYWSGADCFYMPSSADCVSGYYEMSETGEIEYIEDVPPDFHHSFPNWSPPQVFRLKVTTQNQHIKLVCESHNIYPSIFSVYLHPTQYHNSEEPEFIYKTIYTCDSLLVGTEINSWGGYPCDTVEIISTLYDDNANGFYMPDTSVHVGEYVSMCPPYWANNVTINGESTYCVDGIQNQDECYIMCATTPNGCEVVDTFCITVYENNIYVPNAFSPNGDGVNDLFLPYSNQSMMNWEMRIYDRWGGLAYEGNVPWDGGEYGPGVYAYVISITFWDRRTDMVRGDITLFR